MILFLNIFIYQTCSFLSSLCYQRKHALFYFNLIMRHIITFSKIYESNNTYSSLQIFSSTKTYTYFSLLSLKHLLDSRSEPYKCNYNLTQSNAVYIYCIYNESETDVFFSLFEVHHNFIRF